jgi:tetratricopeptide (TPR) repeat protein
MQEVSEATVLGDFEDASFTSLGLTRRFFRRDGGHFVRSEGRDGELADFEIAYTFGVSPLQQYLIRFPDGRIQALDIAWDSRPESEGGQRWFSLYPDERFAPDDPLHWTGRLQNWNYMCADCHSTRVERNYRADEDRFETSFAEIDVSCEACHGPGSAHVAWAEARGPGDSSGDPGLAVDLRRGSQWRFEPEAPIARRHGSASPLELETCARCHSRRSSLRESEPGRPLLDTHRPALLDEGLYHADGQILDEVYVYGSFLQSRMHAQGVTCSDCHDPHGLELRAEGNALCAGCHQPTHYDRPEHHHHPVGSPGAQCVACHMPSRVYMGVDARRDHGFRVPDPHRSAALGAPDACTDCHTDRTAGWAASAVEGWTGRANASAGHFGAVLEAGRRGAPGAGQALARLAGADDQAGIVRATALRLLREQPGPDLAEAVSIAARDDDGLVRLAALEAAEALEPGTRLRLAGPLLRDPLLAVRLQAATTLAPVPPALWSPGDRVSLAKALDEYRGVQELHADLPESHLNLGVLHATFGELEAAANAYRTALRIDPGFSPASINLSDVYRAQGRDTDGERALRAALERLPQDADLLHALGLLLVRERRLEEAIRALEEAARRAPDRARYAYAHALALDAAGERGQALRTLEEVQVRHPVDRDVLTALVTLNRDAGSSDAARHFAQLLVSAAPDDPGARALLDSLAPESSAED